MNSPLNKLSNILKILHITNHFKIATELLSGSNMNKYQHMYPNTPLIGGAKRTNEIVEYKGAKFIFYYYADEHSMQYVLHPHDDVSTQCLIILVDLQNLCAVLHGVTYDKSCFEDKNCKKFSDEFNGSTILKIAFKVIDQLKNKYKLKYITLIDSSYKDCYKYDTDGEIESAKQIDLDSFLMLTTSNTWYGKYGFVPYDSSQEKTNKLKLRDYKKNQEIVTNTLLKNTNIKKIILKAIIKHKLNFSVKEIEEIINKYIQKNRSVKNFLKDLASKYDRTCELFYYSYKEIMEDLKMIDLHGTTYWKKLE